MQELVLGVRSSAWAKGIPLGKQLITIAAHGFKYVNVIFDPDQSQAERREAVKRGDRVWIAGPRCRDRADPGAPQAHRPESRKGLWCSITGRASGAGRILVGPGITVVIDRRRTPQCLKHTYPPRESPFS